MGYTNPSADKKPHGRLIVLGITTWLAVVATLFGIQSMLGEFREPIPSLTHAALGFVWPYSIFVFALAAPFVWEKRARLAQMPVRGLLRSALYGAIIGGIIGIWPGLFHWSAILIGAMIGAIFALAWSLILLVYLGISGGT